MRNAYSDVAVIHNTDSAGIRSIGISLGYDFCAEHEWGSTGIRNKLGVAPSISVQDYFKNFSEAEKTSAKTIDDYRVHKSSNLFLFLFSEKINKVSSNSWDSKNLAQIEKLYKTSYCAKHGKKNAAVPLAHCAFLACLEPYTIDFLVSEATKKGCVEFANSLKENSGPIVLSAADLAVLSECYTLLDKTKLKYVALKEAVQELDIEIPSTWVKSWFNSKPGSTWGSDEFLFVAYGKQDSAVIEELYATILAEGPVYYGVQPTNNPFSRSSIVILKREFSAQERLDVKDKLEGTKLLAKTVLDSGIIKNLQAANKSYYSLSPSLQEDGSIKYWLNPAQQDKYNSGWYSLEDLQAWVRNEGPIVKQ